MNPPTLYLANHPDGSQTLVTLWTEDVSADNIGEVATRPDSYARWSVPTPLEVAP